MFGNLIRECGVLDSLSETAQKQLANLITLFLGITISFSMTADSFVNPQTLMIMGLGLVAFVFDTISGVLFAKLINLFSKKESQSDGRCGGHLGVPDVGACGTEARLRGGQSEFPFDARSWCECVGTNCIRYRGRRDFGSDAAAIGVVGLRIERTGEIDGYADVMARLSWPERVCWRFLS